MIHMKWNVIFFLNQVIIRIFRIDGWLISDFLLYWSKLKKIKFDILHAHMGQEGYYSTVFSKYLSIPLVTSFYGADMSSAPKVLMWQHRYEKLFKVGSAFIVEGIEMKKKLIQLGCAKEKIFIVPITVPLKQIDGFKRKNYNITKTCKILMVANFYEKKGYATAMKVFEYLKNQNFPFTVGIVGDGPMAEFISDSLKKLNTQNSILYGKLKNTEIYKLSESYDIFFHPSETASDGDTEGGAPTVILEMQYIGLPIVSTNHRDIPNIIPKENHYLSDEKDAEGLGKTIINLFKNQDEWPEIGRRGRDFVLSQHSPHILNSKLQIVYEFCLEKYRA